MKKHYLGLVLLIALCISNRSQAQLVGANGFIQGAWVEIGVCSNAAFGVQAGAPAGYHPHQCCGSPTPTAGAPLAEMYDYGHDGWTVGSPAFMGDYTYPGSPFEGWEIQMNGTRSQQYASPAYAFTPYNYSGACTMTPSPLTYSNTGSTIKVNWSGNFNSGASTLNIKQETRVDTFADAVVVTNKIYNTSAAVASNVYVWRSCDPDNDETFSFGTFTIPGAGFPTNNTVNYQNDIDHRVAVTGTAQGTDRAPLTLGTKDCRCVALVYNSWGLTVTQDLAAVWNRTYSPASYTVGAPDNGDIGIGLVCNLGNIAAGDSATLSYAYIFNGPSGIDSSGAFPEPGVTIAGGTPHFPPAPYPNVVTDTYNVCLNPTVSLPIDLLYAEDRAWTWSTWTWSPATGLSTTTGAHVIVTPSALPPIFTYTVTGSDPATCQTRTMLITILTCNNVRSNYPCEGDTLFLRQIGDSTGATYYWYGPPGWSSTLQNPFIYPATMADSTWFYVIKTVGSLHDTDSIPVAVHIKPNVTATNNGPLCRGAIDTLQLNVTPGMVGMTYSWSGPPSFTATTESPIVPGYVDADTGLYTVIVTTPYGCKDTATTRAHMKPQPPTPLLTNRNYCSGQPFVPFHIDSVFTPNDSLYWWSAATGGTSTLYPTPTQPTMSTALVGTYYVWVSQVVNGCESRRGEDSFTVFTTPLPPRVSGDSQYCQGVGPFDTITVVPTGPTDSIKWYTVATGGIGVSPEPVPNINVVPPGGVYHYWVSLKLSEGCEGPRTPVNIIIHPKPARPTVVSQSYCQYWVPDYLKANFDGTDPPEYLTWYGPGIPSTGTTSVWYPNTNVAPDTTVYYVTETTMYNCVSDSAPDPVIIRVKPTAPITTNTRYCQQASDAKPLNLLVDSLWNSDSLKWYYNAVPLAGAPIPNTNTAPGFTTWWVSQWVNGCQSDSSAVRVEIVYLPKFSIWASNPWVCQYDSLQFAYKGPQLFEAQYAWTLPEGAVAVGNTNTVDSMITVRFDSADQNHFIVKLRASDDSGFCATDTTVQIKVIPQPTMTIYTKPDVCLGDTTQLALITRSSGAYDFTWWVDNNPLMSSPDLTVVSANSNSGGPFMISWVDTGKHVVSIITVTQEGCRSRAAYDSVDVHVIPDASFQVVPNTANANICLEDSILFTATTTGYNYLYEWGPAETFNNNNKPSIWGKLRSAKDIITLKVTDPWGCYATSSTEIDPQSCCKLVFPNAFAPDAVDAHPEDRYFAPIFPEGGYHRFHMFRIVNRWGQTVFESANSSDARWDGRFNGVPQDMGTYFYYIKFDCGGQTIEQKGDVTLIR